MESKILRNVIKEMFELLDSGIPFEEAIRLTSPRNPKRLEKKFRCYLADAVLWTKGRESTQEENFTRLKATEAAISDCDSTCLCGGVGRIIAYSDDAPPQVVPCPRDFKGLIWRYETMTPEAVAEAAAEHEEHWTDWVMDPALKHHECGTYGGLKATEAYIAAQVAVPVTVTE